MKGKTNNKQIYDMIAGMDNCYGENRRRVWQQSDCVCVCVYTELQERLRVILSTSAKPLDGLRAFGRRRKPGTALALCLGCGTRSRGFRCNCLYGRV